MKSNRKYHCPSHIVKIKLFGGTYCLLHLYINVHTYSKSHKKGWKTQRYSSSRNLPNLWSWPWKESRYKSPSHRWPQPSPEEELPFIIMVTLLWDCSSNCHSLSVCYLPGSVLNSLHSSAPLTFTVTPGSGCYYTPLYGWENQGSERWRIDHIVRLHSTQFREIYTLNSNGWEYVFFYILTTQWIIKPFYLCQPDMWTIVSHWSFNLHFSCERDWVLSSKVFKKSLKKLYKNK